MSSAYFAPLVTKPVIITVPGKYQTRRGEVVTIDTVSTKHDFGCTGMYSNEIPERWHKSGKLFAGRDTLNDIVRLLTL